MTPTGPGINPRAIAWALLSQVIWLPLMAIDMHDRWLAHLRQITPPSGSAQLDRDIARSPALGLDKLLDATAPVKDLARNAITSTGVLLSTAGSGATSLLDRPLSRSIEELLPQNHGSASAAHPGSSNSQPPAARTAVSGSGSGENWLNNHFTRAQLLGGSVDLNDLHEGSMSPLAMVERAASLSSGDPMGPLPSMWRNPMRQALLQLPGGPRRIATARVIHVPSLSVSHSTEVPLAIQSDGSVDILQTPDNPAVIKEIDTWSRHQQRPAVGSVVPAVIHLHPLEPAPVLTPDSRPAAQTTLHSAAPAAPSTASSSSAANLAPVPAAAAPMAEAALPSVAQPSAPVAAAPVVEASVAPAPLAASPAPSEAPVAAPTAP